MEIGITTYENGKLSASSVEIAVQNALDTVNSKWDANLELRELRSVGAYRIRFLLKPRAVYAGGSTFTRTGYSNPNRRISSVCYHGHLAFFTELYRQFSVNVDKVHVRTAMANWDDVHDFRRDAWQVAGAPMGNQYQPMQYRDMCLCEEELYSAVESDHNQL